LNGSEEVFVKDIFYLLSLAQDSDIDGNYFHGLRVALLAERIAQELIPEERDLIFFASLLHDLGAPSSKGHIICCPDLKIQILNEEIRNHP
jgi:HD superfamily phosphodiesterase